MCKIGHKDVLLTMIMMILIVEKEKALVVQLKARLYQDCITCLSCKGQDILGSTWLSHDSVDFRIKEEV